jgi:hypothetical protein
MARKRCYAENTVCMLKNGGDDRRRRQARRNGPMGPETERMRKSCQSIGSLFLGVRLNGMTLMNISEYWKPTSSAARSSSRPC